MKHLPWMCALLLASQGLLGCSEDETEPAAASGSGGSGNGGRATTAGSAGKTSNIGGSKAGNGGTPAVGEAGSGGAPQATPKDIIDTALAAGSFTQLAAALTEADLVEALKGDGPFTVFAPTDDAFAAFEDENPGVLAGLSKAELSGVLTYHVISGVAALSTSLKDDQVLVTLAGSPVLIDLTGGAKIADAAITTPDIVASNGVIHVIDKIILPPNDDLVSAAVAAGMFTSLTEALTAADLVTTLQGDGPFTVFAPTDAAFDALSAAPTGDALKDVLLYHVVDGAVGSGDLQAGMVPTLLEDQSLTVDLDDGVKINDASVTTANIIAKNGVIHVVDTILVPE
ncbi:MAG TPA: fasciclin domain-containing protein [Polyangiaceae bacterium]|nr:fasciclin domain-containing protein [Polyangiaceae bacterium]